MTFIEKEQIRKNFCRGASTYDQYAKVQKKMAQELSNKITAVGKEFREILEIGCGTGFLTELLAREFPRANILALDISPRMIKVAKKKLSSYSNITYLVEDGENLRINGSFDLIVSNAVFQWFNNYFQPFALYHKNLKEDGCFIFSTLGEQTFRELGQALSFLGLESPKEALINAGELGQILKTCGFAKWTVEEQLLKDYHASARELLVGIKKIGAQSHCFSARGFCLKGGDIFKLAVFLNSRYREGKGVYITYQVLYGFAQKSRQTN
ncbi:MAG: malonyl-ACP O-methyltransferase BioC [Bacillota bacterium]